MHDAPPSRKPSLPIAGILFGLLGAALIWVITPYSSFVLRNSNIIDSYLPVLVVFLTLALVLGYNPLMRRIGWGVMSRRQLAVALGIMLVACVLPSMGLLRSLTFSLARHARVQNDALISDEYQKMHLPPSLFPQKEQGRDPAQASEDYIDGLQPDQSIPWRSWVGPLVTWGTFLTFTWMMMVGLAMVVYPQWRNNERLAFPLLTVQQSLIEDPEPGRLLPPMLRTRAFWIAMTAVFLLYLMYGANTIRPDRVPAIPLKWNLTSLFSEPPWTQMAGYLRMGRLYFLFVGVAFFMPTRISFSIWFFLVVYGLYRTFAPLVPWPNYIDQIDDQRYGAVIMLALIVLWIGRAHWATVFRSMFRRGGSAEQQRDRRSGWTLTIGLTGMFAWLIWVGLGSVRVSDSPVRLFIQNAGWALMLVAFSFMVSLLIARIVAETGLPFVRLPESPLTLMILAPVGVVASVSLFLAVIIEIIVSVGSRVSATVMSMHAIGLHPDATPRQETRTGVGLIGLLMVGLVVAGGANLVTAYRYNVAPGGATMNQGAGYDLGRADAAIKERQAGQFSQRSYPRWAFFGGGAALAGGLYVLCITVPRWPIHPFGLLLVDSYYGHEAFPSILVGWLLQVLIVRFGGASAYRKARPVFMGLIIGEVLAAIVWAIVPLVQVAAGYPPRPVHILPN